MTSASGSSLGAYRADKSQLNRTAQWALGTQLSVLKLSGKSSLRAISSPRSVDGVCRILRFKEFCATRDIGYILDRGHR